MENVEVEHVPVPQTVAVPEEKEQRVLGQMTVGVRSAKRVRQQIVLTTGLFGIVGIVDGPAMMVLSVAAVVVKPVIVLLPNLRVEAVYVNGLVNVD